MRASVSCPMNSASLSFNLFKHPRRQDINHLLSIQLTTTDIFSFWSSQLCCVNSCHLCCICSGFLSLVFRFRRLQRESLFSSLPMSEMSWFWKQIDLMLAGILPKGNQTSWIQKYQRGSAAKNWSHGEIDHVASRPDRGKLIDLYKWYNGFMADGIPPGNDWQEDIHTKLCTNYISGQRAPFCQPASGWQVEWLMTAVSLLSTSPRHPCRMPRLQQ